jgi:ribonuclease Z
VAREAEVVMLALNHVSTRHPVRVLREEARAIFAATVVPRDFDTIEVPFAERGEPELVRWDGRAAPPPDPSQSAPEAGAAAPEAGAAAPEAGAAAPEPTPAKAT